MNALVSASARFALTNDGSLSLWTPTSSLSYRFWTRYLDIYQEVRLLVRAVSYTVPPEGWIRATGPQVTAVPVPDFGSPWQLGRNYRQLQKVVRSALLETQAMHLRIPCLLGGIVQHSLERTRPYGIEVVGDPYEVFAPGAVKHPLRPFFRWWFSHQLRRQIARACATAYVTEKALQRRYPPAPGAFVTHYSSVELPAGSLLPTPRPAPRGAGILTLIAVGSLAQLYKAPDILIDAVGLCLRAGLELNLVLVGEGKHRAELEARARAQGLSERVRFLGQLPAGKAVRAQLDQADLFVLPSKTEGVPKAMIEAMARGLPCIGSTVGGIPELLPPEDMVPPGDAVALAAKIRAVLTDPERMARMSARNLEKAQEYCEEILRQRRIAFYSYVREKTEEWLKTQKR